MTNTKHKAIAIPVIHVDGDSPLFLTARDRRHGEWLFVTGGCRKREISNPLRTAIRELLEETRGVVDLKSGEYADFVFKVPGEDEDTELVYTCFVFFLALNQEERDVIVRRFTDEVVRYQLRKLNKQPIRRVFDENDMLAWSTLEEFNARPFKWSLIVENVVKNDAFYEALRTSAEKRKLFNFNKS